MADNKLDLDIGGYLPGERIMVATLELIGKTNDRLSDDLFNRIMTIHIENLEWWHKRWREIWSIEKPKPKEG